MDEYVARGAGAVREHGLWLTAVLGVGTFLGLFLVGESGAVIDALASVEPWTVPAVLLLVTAGYGVRFLKWEYYLRTLDVEVSIRTSALVFFSGLMLTVTPGKLGEVWKAWFLRDLADVPASTTTSVVGAERVTDVLALTAFASLGVFVYRQSILVLVGVGTAFVVGLGVLQWRSLCLGVLERSRNVPIIGRYAPEFRAFYEGTYSLFRPRPLSVATGLSLASWGLEGLAFWLVLEGFGAAATPALGLFVFGLGSVIGAVSMLPGGLAATEASMVGVLLALGYAPAVAAGATLLVRVLTLWYGAVFGTVVFGAYRLGGRHRRDGRPD